MHEMAVTRDILNTALQYAAANKARRIISVALKIGAMRDVVDAYMQRFFNYLSRETIADGAALKIEHTPVTFLCVCGGVFPASLKKITSGKPIVCPYCRSKDAVLNSGREFEIIGIEVI
jgi:hydrogenase nickel incorporation protein HypA/HybF